MICTYLILVAVSILIKDQLIIYYKTTFYYVLKFFFNVSFLSLSQIFTSKSLITVQLAVGCCTQGCIVQPFICYLAIPFV